MMSKPAPVLHVTARQLSKPTSSAMPTVSRTPASPTDTVAPPNILGIEQFQKEKSRDEIVEVGRQLKALRESLGILKEISDTQTTKKDQE
jgi:hypothetical protein